MQPDAPTGDWLPPRMARPEHARLGANGRPLPFRTAWQAEVATTGGTCRTGRYRLPFAGRFRRRNGCCDGPSDLASDASQVRTGAASSAGRGVHPMIEGDVADSGVGFLAGHAPRTCRLLDDRRNAAAGVERGHMLGRRHGERERDCRKQKFPHRLVSVRRMVGSVAIR